MFFVDNSIQWLMFQQNVMLSWTMIQYFYNSVEIWSVYSFIIIIVVKSVHPPIIMTWGLKKKNHPVVQGKKFSLPDKQLFLLTCPGTGQSPHGQATLPSNRNPKGQAGFQIFFLPCNVITKSCFNWWFSLSRHRKLKSKSLNA